MFQNCDRCGLEYKWAVSSSVFSTDLRFEKIEICNDCINKLQEIIKKWKLKQFEE